MECRQQSAIHVITLVVHAIKLVPDDVEPSIHAVMVVKVVHAISLF
ncbi:hypothetical protein [Streptomyces sp. NPDC048309]